MRLMERMRELEPLVELSVAGYKSLARRASDDLTTWYSSLDSGIRAKVGNSLAGLPSSRPVAVLYVARAGSSEVGEWEVRDSALLEASVNGALGELKTLSSKGEVGGLALPQFDRLLFALGFSAFGKQLSISETYGVALKVAVAYYASSGRSDFAGQLSQYGSNAPAGLGSALDENAPSALNVVLCLRNIYRAAENSPSGKGGGALDLQGLRARPHLHLVNDEQLVALAGLLERVAIHKGVEAVIEGCGVLPERQSGALLLAKMLHTITTGKMILDAKGKEGAPLCEAIGISELVYAGTELARFGQTI